MRQALVPSLFLSLWTKSAQFLVCRVFFVYVRVRFLWAEAGIWALYAEGGSISSFLGRGGSFSCVSEVSLGSICAEGGSISSFLGRIGSFSCVSEVSLGSICAEGGSISSFLGKIGSFSCVSEVSLVDIYAEGDSISSFLGKGSVVFWCFLFAWRPYLETDRFRGRSIGKIRRSSRIFIRYVFFFASSSLRR